MGEISGLTILWAGLAAGVVMSLGWGGFPKGGSRLSIVLYLVLLWAPAAMLGHAFARIGADTLAAKPWLYAMQSGGLALAFVIPALWQLGLRDCSDKAKLTRDGAVFLLAYLAMGAVFWARA